MMLSAAAHVIYRTKQVDSPVRPNKRYSTSDFSRQDRRRKVRRKELWHSSVGARGGPLCQVVLVFTVAYELWFRTLMFCTNTSLASTASTVPEMRV